MVDGTGMCGACRVTVGGESRFACVDGPDFDGHLVDFEELMSRQRIYSDLERDKRAVWEGVANALALIHLRAVRKGDTIVIYHTGSEKSAVGLARATRGAYPDPALADPRRVVVGLAPVGEVVARHHAPGRGQERDRPGQELGRRQGRQRHRPVGGQHGEDEVAR